MTGKRDRAGRTDLSRQVRALMEATADLPVEEIERRAKAVHQLAKAQAALHALQPKGSDERLDAAGEARLRRALLERLDRLAAEIRQARAVQRAGGRRPQADRD